MKARFISVLKILFFFSLGLFLLWLSAKNLTEADKQEMYTAFSKADYTWVCLSMFLGILSHVSRAIRWNMLLKPLGYNPRTLNTFFAVMVGYFANFAFPRLGEVTRCGILKRYEKIPLNQSFGTVIAERAIDLICLVIIFMSVIFMQYDILYSLANEWIITPFKTKMIKVSEQQTLLMILGVVGITVIGLLITFRKKFQAGIFVKIKMMLLGFVEGLRTVMNIKSPLAFLAHSLFIWIMYYLMIHVCFFSINETAHLGINEALAVMVIGSVGIIFIPGGIGAYHILVSETLLIYHIEDPIPLAFAWIVWTSQFVLLMFSGVVSLILLPIINKSAKHE